jgi:hypothetical protein
MHIYYATRGPAPLGARVRACVRGHARTTAPLGADVAQDEGGPVHPQERIRRRRGPRRARDGERLDPHPARAARRCLFSQQHDVTNGGDTTSEGAFHSQGKGILFREYLRGFVLYTHKSKVSTAMSYYIYIVIYIVIYILPCASGAPQAADGPRLGTHENGACVTEL